MSGIVVRDYSKEKLLKTVEKKKKEIAALCSETVKIPTENPPGETSRLGGFLKDYLKELGLSVKAYEPRKGMPNLITSFGSGQEGHLVVNAHMDVLPAGDGWSFQPFCGRIVEGRILGRGAVDMKAGLCASISALASIVEMGTSTKGKVTLNLVSDEESMGTWGTQWLLSHVPEAKGDACLIGEPGGTDVITFGEKGVWWLILKSKGVEAHAAYGAGENAIIKLSKATLIAKKLERIEGKIPRELTRIIQSQKTDIERKYWKGTARAVDHLTVNIGVIKGGLKTNLVPPSCDASLDMRLPLGLSQYKLEHLLRNELRAVGLEGIEIETIFSINPNYTKPSHPLVRIATRNVAHIARRRPRLFFRLGSTDGKFFRSAGIPVVTYGVSPQRMGEVDEYVEVDELLTVTKVHAGIIYDYISASGP